MERFKAPNLFNCLFSFLRALFVMPTDLFLINSVLSTQQVIIYTFGLFPIVQKSFTIEEVRKREIIIK